MSVDTGSMLRKGQPVIYIINGVKISMCVHPVGNSPYKDGGSVEGVADQNGQHSIQKIHGTVRNMQCMVAFQANKKYQDFRSQTEHNKPKRQLMPDIAIADSTVDIDLQTEHLQKKDEISYGQ